MCSIQRVVGELKQVIKNVIKGGPQWMWLFTEGILMNSLVLHILGLLHLHKPIPRLPITPDYDDTTWSRPDNLTRNPSYSNSNRLQLTSILPTSFQILMEPQHSTQRPTLYLWLWSQRSHYPILSDSVILSYVMSYHFILYHSMLSYILSRYMILYHIYMIYCYIISILYHIYIT